MKNGEHEVSKFAFRGSFEEEPIRDYIETYFRGDLKPYFKSERVRPERERAGGVRDERDEWKGRVMRRTAARAMR